jgi:predicted thioesterase
MDIEAGISARADLVVGDADTALAMGSGDVPVLATPRVVALVEAAAVAALAGRLPAGSTSVGSRIEVDHLEPTPVGATVTATAIVVSVDGRAVSFDVVVGEAGSTVARGSHTRIVVDRVRFTARTAERRGHSSQPTLTQERR